MIIILLAMAIIGAIFGMYWLVTLSVMIWTAMYSVSFINGVINYLNPSVSRMGTLICGVKAFVGIYILIWAFT